MLVFPPKDTAFVSRSAAPLQSAPLACIGPVAQHEQTLLLSRLVSQNVHVFQFHNIPGLLSHPCEKIPVIALICDLVGDDQVVSALTTLLNMPAVPRAGRHCARIGVGQRYLTVRRIIQGLLHCQEPFNLAPDAMIPASQMGCTFCPSLACFLTVNPFSFLDIASDLGFQMRQAAGNLPFAEVTITVIDRLEFAAIYRDQVPLQHANPTAELNELCAGLPDGGAVVAPEIGDGLMVGHQSTGQPHQLDIAPRLRSSRRLDGIRFKHP